MTRKRKGIPRREAGQPVIKKQWVETDDVRDWAGLEKYLLEDVLGKLPITDCLSFGIVCKPWGIIASKFLVESDRRVPCLVKRGQNEVTTRSCFSLVGNSKFSMDLPEAYGKCIWGSFQDWLFLGKMENCRLDMSLLNPFSGENIGLPRVKPSFFLLVISANPTNEKCICMLVDLISVAFWIPGAAKWHETSLGGWLLLDALYYNGCFYLLERYHVVAINEKSIMSMLDTGAEIRTESLSVRLPFYPERVRSCLVEPRGKILLVCRFFYGNDGRRGETSSFEIYMLDLNKLAWLRLWNLDNQILFVGSGCSKSFDVEDLGGTFANRVYFINQAWFSPRNECTCYDYGNCDEFIEDWGVFSFQKQIHLQTVFQERPKQWAGVWLTAPLGWCLKQKRL